MITADHTVMNLLAWLIWALFGNDEDGVLGDRNYNPAQIDSIWWRIGWWLRNPMHNLMFHVPPFGLVGRQFTRTGNCNVFVEPWGGWGWAVIRYKWMRLPFISYYGRIKFYFGWRERGNFGMKLTWNSKWSG